MNCYATVVVIRMLPWFVMTTSVTIAGALVQSLAMSSVKPLQTTVVTGSHIRCIDRQNQVPGVDDRSRRDRVHRPRQPGRPDPTKVWPGCAPASNERTQSVRRSGTIALHGRTGYYCDFRAMAGAVLPAMGGHLSMARPLNMYRASRLVGAGSGEGRRPTSNITVPGGTVS